MIETVTGMFLLASPFLLITRFKDTRLGFACIALSIILLHLFLALFTQALSAFTYWVVVAANALVLFLVLLKTEIRKIPGAPKRPDPVLLAVLLIGFLHLYSVHYDYSGKISILPTPVYQEVDGMRYPYPYYADEWYAVAFIKRSISSHSLPFDNPLQKSHGSLLNFEFAFHSFLSEIILLLDLDPLTDYGIISVFLSLLVCSLVYLFLVFEGVGRLTAGVAALSLLYLTNGSNLPGLWYLTPVILGMISMLLFFFFASSGRRDVMLICAIPVLLFYPPLAPFFILASFVYFIRAKDLPLIEKAKSIMSLLLIFAFAAFLLSLAHILLGESLDNVIDHVLYSRLYYQSYTQDAIPHYLMWDVIPLPVIALSILGVLTASKRREWLLSILLLGVLYWTLYSFVTFRLVIEYQRAVVFTGILVVVFSGFGIDYVARSLKRYDTLKRYRVTECVLVLTLVFFLVSSQSYTQREDWIALTMFDPATNRTFMPAAPANNYLHPDDMRVFASIRGEKFLSIPWKGTVIGVATDNYPLCTKTGTITIYQNAFAKFMDVDCAKKLDLMKKGIDYVYAPPFDCPGFEVVDRSTEGLFLYRVRDA